MASKIIITFLQVPEPNYTINFGETTMSMLFMERFRPQRVQPNQVTIPLWFDSSVEGEPIIVYNGYSSNNFKTAFELDYNASGLFTVTAIPDVGAALNGKGTVTIEANYPNAVFTYIPDGLGIVSVTIMNETVNDFSITNIAISQATNPCTHVLVSVTTSELATSVLSPIVIENNVDNPVVFEVIRGQTYNVAMTNEDGFLTGERFITPPFLSASNFNINISNSPNGSTASIINSGPTVLAVQYSLDNDEWQTSNVFSGLTSGDYTLYVRDNYGCSFTIDFNVNDNAIYVPYFQISPSNSIRFAQRVTFGDAGNYKNDENTLSCEADVKLPYLEKQLFQTADVITTQFESNYGNREVKVIRKDGSEIVVPIIQKTNNIGIKDKRTAIKYNLGDGKTGIYFMAGNIYNYDTNDVIGTHALNGTLPEWAIIGNYVNIDSAWYIIENTFFDENKNADVVVIMQTYTGMDETIIAASIYNDFPYEVYEFTIDMVNYIDEEIRVKLINSDTHFGTITHLSELINVKVRHENTLCHDYWNDDNTDIFYATGIRHRIRIPFTRVESFIDEESSINKTDTKTVMLSGMLYKGKNITYEPVTEGIWDKLCRALSHKNVLIDNVPFVKSGEFETEAAIEDTNLYVLTAKMLKSTSIYSTSGTSILNGSSNDVEIPGIIEGDAGFIKY